MREKDFSVSQAVNSGFRQNRFRVVLVSRCPAARLPPLFGEINRLNNSFECPAKQNAKDPAHFCPRDVNAKYSVPVSPAFQVKRVSARAETNNGKPLLDLLSLALSLSLSLSSLRPASPRKFVYPCI